MTRLSPRYALLFAAATAVLGACRTGAEGRSTASLPSASASVSTAAAPIPSASATLSAPLLPPAVAVPQSTPAGDVGSPHPAMLQAVSPDGHWMVLCQARKDTDGDGKIEISVGHHGDLAGDEMELFFVRGSGLGAPIQAYAGADRSGRHVVIARGRTLVLLDTFASRETELAGAIVDDGSTAFAGRGSISFDDAGRRLVYVRATERGDAIVVRELATGVEQIVDAGPGLLWRAQLDAGGELVVAQMIVEDTDRNGVIERPTLQTSLSKRACRGPVMSYSTGGLRGDQPVPRVARAVDGWKSDGASLRGDPLGVFGRAVLVRRSDGAIIRRDGPSETVLLPPDCAARIVHTEASKERVFFGCTGGAKTGSSGFVRAPLERLDGVVRTPLGLTVELPSGDDWVHDRELLHVDGGKALQLSTGTIGPINVGPPKAVVGDKVLFARHSIGSPGGPNILDLATGDRAKVVVEISLAGHSARRGNLIALEVDKGRSALLDVSTNEVKGRFDGAPLALSTGNKVLVSVPSTQGKRRPDRLLEGPFRWVAVP